MLPKKRALYFQSENEKAFKKEASHKDAWAINGELKSHLLRIIGSHNESGCKDLSFNSELC